MSVNWEFLAAASEDERIDVVAESYAVSIQFAVQKAMSRGGISQKELAERLGVSPARVSQYLSAHGRNLTLRTLAKIANAIGEDFEFISLHDMHALKSRAQIRERRSIREVAVDELEIPASPWTDLTANVNKFPSKLAA